MAAGAEPVEGTSSGVDATAGVSRRARKPMDPAAKRRLALRVGALLVVVIVLSVIGYRSGWFDVKRIARLLERLRTRENPWIASSIFFAVLVIAVAVGFPALPFMIAGGAIFGLVLGSALSWTAATAGSVLGYFLARSVGRETARRWIARRSMGAALTADSSFWTLLRLRLIPVVPLSVVNFASGLARTRLGPYTLATAIGILPATIVYSYFADSLVSGLSGAKSHALRDVIIASGVLVVLSMVPVVINRAGSRE